MKSHVLARLLVSVLAGACVLWAVSGPSSALALGGHGQPQSFAYSPNAHVKGHSQEYWSAKLWKWLLEHPVLGHPAADTPDFDVSSGQTGSVWFLGTPLVYTPTDSTQRTVTIPEGKSLFVTLVSGEWSSLEGAPTEGEQRDIAVWQADHVVPGSLSCTLDGQTLANPDNYRQESPQFAFTAPNPWFWGSVSGPGTSVADGYYVFLKELQPGQHTLHFTGQFHFTLADDGFDFDGYANMTYDITQLGGCQDD